MVEYDPQEKNLVRKLDYHVIPYLVLVFFCSHLTWNNVDQARTASFAATTYSPWAQISHWKGHDQEVLVKYEVAIPLAFSIGFAFFVFPSNLLLRYVYPSRWFSILLGLLGFSSIITASVTDFGGLMTLQLISGILSAGMLPGILLYITIFYIKEEYGLRIAGIIALSEFVTYAFSTLLPSGVGMDLEGAIGGTVQAWRWMFMLNGIPCILGAVAIWFNLPNYPSTAEFLTPADRILAAQRIRDVDDPDPQQDEDLYNPFTTEVASYEPNSRLKGINGIARPPKAKIHFAQIKEWIKEYRFSIFTLAVAFLAVSNSIMVSRMPHVTAEVLGSLVEKEGEAAEHNGTTIISNGTGTIINGTIRYDNRAWWTPSAMILTCIPKLTTTATTIYLSYRADKGGERALYAAIPMLVSSLSLLTIAMVDVSGLRYFLLFISDAGLHASFPVILAYAIDHAHGDTTKAMVTAGSLFIYPMGKAVTHILFPDIDSRVYATSVAVSNSTLNDGGRGSAEPKKFTLPGDMAIFSTAALCACIGAFLVLLARYLYRREEAGMWAKAPGLRRLLNDAEETNAWEMDDDISTPKSKKTKKNTMNGDVSQKSNKISANGGHVNKSSSLKNLVNPEEFVESPDSPKMDANDEFSDRISAMLGYGSGGGDATAPKKAKKAAAKNTHDDSDWGI